MNEEKIKVLGMLDIKGHDIQRRVYATDGLSPTLHCMQGGNLQPKVLVKETRIVAMRGRNPSDPTSRIAGQQLEQRLELGPDGIANTITTVQKDNLVMETVKIKQPTKQGYEEMEMGGVADFLYPKSKTRRGRVQENGTVSPTLTASNIGIYRIESYYRIRKLTPLECYRLMGVTDEEAKKMLSVNSNSQCYKQAGNSIVVDVMAAMFKKLF